MNVPESTRKTYEEMDEQEGRRTRHEATEASLKESEANYRALIDDLPELICRSAPDLTRLYVNEGYCRYFGKSRKELIGRSFLELLPEEDHEPLKEHLTSLSPENPVGTFEHRVFRYDGEVRWQQWTNRVIFDEDGEFLGYQAVGRDFNVRKLAEEALKESEERLRSLADASFEGIAICDEEGMVEEANRAFTDMFGYGLEEVRGRPALEFHVPEHRDAVWQKISSGSGEDPYESEGLRKDGTTFDVEIRGRVASRGDNTVLISALRDITERKRAERALRESEERYRAVVEDQSELICRYLPDTTLTFANGAYCRYFGKKREELIGCSFVPLILEEDREKLAEHLSRLGPESPARTVEHRVKKPDGEVRWQQWTNRAIFDERGRLLECQSVGRDVTERKEAEEALRESEERFRQLFENSADALFVLYPETREIVDCNAEACRSLGYSREDLLTLRMEDFVREVLSEEEKRRRGPDTPWRRALAGEPGTIIGFHENVHRRKDGTTFPVEVGVGSIDYAGRRMILASCRDATERKGAERALKESEERYRRLVELSPEAIAVHDGSKLLFLNPAGARLFGAHAPGELVGRPVLGFVHPDDREIAASRVRGVIEGGERAPLLEERYLRVDGGIVDVEVAAQAVTYAGKRAVQVVLRDVTERKRAEEALRESEVGLAEAQRMAHLGSWEYAVGQDEARWSDELYRIFGRDPQRFVPAPKTFLRSVHPEDREPLLKKVREALYEGKHYDGHGAEFRVVRPDGEVRAVHARYEVIREDEGGRPVKMAGTVQDVTERKALEDRLEHQAFHDPLTGLPNRALLMDRLGHALARMERRGGKVGMLFLDLDDFKYINDSLGHDAGDRLLIVAAGRIEGCVRPGDTVARLGGDEFAVLLEEVKEAGDAARVAERTVEALGEPIDLGGCKVFSGTSVGIALGTAGRERPDDLLRKADLALYEAKRGGKARYALFDPEAERRSMRRLELENGLRRAIERDEFRVCYQPVVSLKTGRIVGVEALVRWEHPERGLVSPTEFVPLAEENGLIVPIGQRVLKEACQQAGGWQEARRPDEPLLTVGVNLSARQLSHPDLVGDVAGTLEEAGLDPNRLTLEVTEGVLVEEEGRHVGTLRRLRELGVRFAIDDFGTGYSSLSYLRRLPAGLLKLDGSFVGSIGKGAGEDEVLLSGVIGIAQGLGLGVCAEGVETPEQAARLRELGCDLAQGNHFSGPLSAEATSELLVGETPRP